MAFSKLSVFATSKHNTNVKGFALTLLCHQVCQSSVFPVGAGRRGCRPHPRKIHPVLCRPAPFAGSQRAPCGHSQQTGLCMEGPVMRGEEAPQGLHHPGPLPNVAPARAEAPDAAGVARCQPRAQSRTRTSILRTRSWGAYLNHWLTAAKGCREARDSPEPEHF